MNLNTLLSDEEMLDLAKTSFKFGEVIKEIKDCGFTDDEIKELLDMCLRKLNG